MAVKYNMEDILFETSKGFDLFYARRTQKYCQFLHRTNYKQEAQKVNAQGLADEAETSKDMVVKKWFKKMKTMGWTIVAEGRSGNFFISYGQDKIENSIEEEIMEEEIKRVLPTVQEANVFLVNKISNNSGMEASYEVLEELNEDADKCIFDGDFTTSIANIVNDINTAKCMFVILTNREAINIKIKSPKGFWIAKFKELGFVVNKKGDR